MESALVHIKLHGLFVWSMECEESIIVAVIGKYELAIDVLQRQNVGDGLFIKPHLIILLYIGFMGSINGLIIYFCYHVLICCTGYCGKPIVDEEVNIELIIQ